MKTLFLFIFSFTVFITNAQINDIKKSSKSNSSDKGNVSTYSSNGDSDDFTAGCAADILGCCFQNGFAMVFGLLAENNRMIMQNRDADATVISADFKANFALGWHYSSAKTYLYVNYLPEISINLASFTTAFRFNILTEYTNDFPNSFTSWEWLFLFNIQPSPSFKMSLGTGVQFEKYSQSYFNEHYVGFRFRMNNERDFLEANTRLSIDYETGSVPFLEAGIHYKIQIAEFESVYMYISLGGMYQNYYSSHDIWLGRGGLIVNWH
ncbi:MAG: hypothetical protein L3J74_08570 [Bacteroidales bacterium]|nr:hypothetical protein [Bacteroidales bacterium]